MKKLFSRRIILGVNLLLTTILLIVLFINQLLPLKYYIALAVLLILLVLLTYVMQKRKHSVKQVVFKILSILLSIILLVGNIYTFKIAGVLDGITGADSSMLQMSVVVLKDNAAEELKDLKGKKFGGVTASDSVNFNKAETLIEDQIDTITVETYTTNTESLNALYSKKVDALIINEMDRNALKEEKENFDDETKVIETLEIKIPSAKANEAKVTKECFNVFICGTDTYGDVSTAALSDVNMVATINPVTKQIYLTSIPRDYYVEIAGLNNGKDKLTHSAKKGIDCTISTIENFMNIDINYYVKMNFTSFLNIIDAIGGITINNPNGEFVTVKGHYTIKAGENTLNAKEALAFVRERKAFSNGDRVRGQNQQLMIKAVVKKLCSASSITKLDKIFETVASSLETNMSATDVRSLINMEIDDMASWDVQSYHLNGTNSSNTHFATISSTLQRYVMEPKQETIDKAKGYIDAMMENQIIKVEEDKK